MLESIKELDQKLFLELNSYHSPLFDDIMWFITGLISWVPLYLFLTTLIIVVYRKESIYWLLGAGLLILIVDQLTSGFMKPYFGRLRPCHDPEISYLVHIVNNKCGGRHGFVSGHSSNTFAIATYLFFTLRRHFNYMWALFIWSSIVAYSRIYLGVHYPLDIFFGALIGSLCGLGIYLLLVYFFRKKNSLQKI